MLNLKSSLALARDHSTRLALHLSALLCDHFCSKFKLQYTRSKNLLLWGWHTSPRPSSCWRRRLWCLPPPMHGTCPYALWTDNWMTAHTWTAEGVSGCFFVPWKDSLLKKVVDTLKVLNCLVTRECDKCHCDTIYVDCNQVKCMNEKSFRTKFTMNYTPCGMYDHRIDGEIGMWSTLTPNLDRIYGLMGYMVHFLRTKPWTIYPAWSVRTLGAHAPLILTLQ